MLDEVTRRRSVDHTNSEETNTDEHTDHDDDDDDTSRLLRPNRPPATSTAALPTPAMVGREVGWGGAGRLETVEEATYRRAIQHSREGGDGRWATRPAHTHPHPMGCLHPHPIRGTTRPAPVPVSHPLSCWEDYPGTPPLAPPEVHPPHWCAEHRGHRSLAWIDASEMQRAKPPPPRPTVRGGGGGGASVRDACTRVGRRADRLRGRAPLHSTRGGRPFTARRAGGVPQGVVAEAVRRVQGSAVCVCVCGVMSGYPGVEATTSEWLLWMCRCSSTAALLSSPAPHAFSAPAALTSEEPSDRVTERHRGRSHDKADDA